MHRARAICELLCALLLVDLLSAQSSTGGLSLGARERQRVLEKAIADLSQYYLDQDRAQKTVDAFLAHEQAGDYNVVTDGQAFANLLARHLIDASHDVHFTVEYTRKVFPDFSMSHRQKPKRDTRPLFSKSADLRKGRNHTEQLGLHQAQLVSRCCSVSVEGGVHNESSETMLMR